jgi:hypothetical protein
MDERSDKTPPAQDQFVQNWLASAQSAFPESLVVAAIKDATKSSLLDEAKLIRQLREISKPEVEERDGQS